MGDQFGSTKDLENLLRRLSQRVDSLEKTSAGAMGGGSVNTPFSIGGYTFGGAEDQIDLAELAALPYVPPEAVPTTYRFATYADLAAHDNADVRNGDIAYVASSTVYGVTSDCDFKWTAGGWKVWNFPATDSDVEFPCTLQGTTTTPTLGSGGFSKIHGSIRGRLVFGYAITYWGTTAGSVGSGAYGWLTPFTFKLITGPPSEDLRIVGAANILAVAPDNRMGSTVLSNTYPNHLFLLGEQSTPGGQAVGSTAYAGVAGAQYRLHMAGAPMDDGST